MGKFYQCIQSYGPSFMTKFCSALYLENLLTNIFAKLNLRGGVSCMPAALLFLFPPGSCHTGYCFKVKFKFHHSQNTKNKKVFCGTFNVRVQIIKNSIIFILRKFSS